MFALPPQWDERRGALLTMLRRLSYKERDVTLSSGQKSHFYIDCKQTMLTGEGHILLGACFSDLLDRAEQARPSRRSTPPSAV